MPSIASRRNTGSRLPGWRGARGLDPTTFNRSKRIGKTRAARWPSTESIAKVLHCLGLDFEDFARLTGREVRALEADADTRSNISDPAGVGQIPFLAACRAKSASSDHLGKAAKTLDVGALLEADLDAVAIPASHLDGPPPGWPCRHLVVARSAAVDAGDPVVVGLDDGRLLSGVIDGNETYTVRLRFPPPEPALTLRRSAVHWIGRIVLCHY